MAPTLASCDQASNKDNWDSGRLACKRQLLTKIAPRNRLIALVVNGIETCRVLEQGLLRSYGVKTQGVDNGRGAVDLIAFGVITCSEESGWQAFLSASVDVFVEKPLDPEHLVP
ncbi:hypothetical protein Goshw_025671, partial [Gossypium schwendimanii]|nr:hypothetical protein [Gossypium schwendimanii]